MNLATYFTLDTLKGVVWVLAMLLIHEYGHYVIAKRQGIYKGLMFFIGGMGIQMTTYLKSRWDYLYGILFSFIAFPLFLLLRDPRVEIWYFPVFAVAIGIVDIFVFIFYTPITRAIDRERRNKNGKEN
jgi:hypothetical protein